MNALVRKRPDAVRWVYVPAVLVSALFAATGWDDDGWAAASPFLLLLIVCLVQCAYPTVLGWILIIIPFAAYATVVAFTPGNGTPGDYFFFISCGAVPTIVLQFFRPWSKKATHVP